MCVDPWCLDPSLDPGFTLSLGVPTTITAVLLLGSLLLLERTYVVRIFTLTLFGSLAFQLSALLPGMATTDTTALFWKHALLWGPVLTASTGAHFGLALHGVHLSRNERVLAPLYLCALGVLAGHLTDSIDFDVVQLASGRRDLVTTGPMDGYQRLYGAGCVFLLLGMMGRYAWRWRRHPVRSGPARAMLIALTLPMGLAVMVLFRPGFLRDLPLYHMVAPIFQVTALYAAARHGVFQITESTNARAAIAVMNEALLVVDDRARPLFANPEASERYGIDDEAVARGESIVDVEPLIAAVMDASEGEVVRRETAVLGVPSRVAASKIPRPKRHDVVLVLTDIREEQARTDALRVAKEQALHAKDQAQAASQAKSTFLANMSHELRTPLNAIIGYAELLAEEEADPERQDDLGHIVQSGRYLHVLLGDILDLSKIDAGRLEVSPQTFELAALIAELEAPARLLCKQNHNVLELRCCDTTVVGDPVRVRQILLNLVSNAAKFTHEGQVTLTTTEDEAGAHVRVIDTGIGMDTQQLAALFGRFQQVHRENHAVFGGSGLGLALSRELAILMGGELRAESQAGEGSCFTLTLPRTRDARPTE